MCLCVLVCVCARGSQLFRRVGFEKRRVRTRRVVTSPQSKVNGSATAMLAKIRVDNNRTRASQRKDTKQGMRNSPHCCAALRRSLVFGSGRSYRSRPTETKRTIRVPSVSPFSSFSPSLCDCFPLTLTFHF